ncbi:hypothetical protein [Bacillus sp. EB600]|uniref:hypothetical protein n=1 Tax=Bacillus sp. EB600 TaxID=2806345 RepID=UPI00210CCE48|nr:hypothetical protein [Bacillus sp. EB600]MCQ6282872.1 hypothetical protein [Bacillus sp. EB600]
MLAKKFKEQQSRKTSELSQFEKEVKELKRQNERLESELKEAKREAEWYNDMLVAKQKDYNKVIEALQTLKNIGVQIQIPEPETPKYRVDKDGTVTTLCVV